VDVLAMRYDVSFAASMIGVSCKSGASKALSPAREVFYLKGVLDYLGASLGVVAFSQKPIASHLRDLGRRLNVLVLAQAEVDDWCKSLVNGLPDCGYFQEAGYGQYLNSWSRIGANGLFDYLSADYWFHFDFWNLQNVVGHFRKIASRLTGKEPWHGVVVLDAAAHLCLTIFDLCRQIRLLGPSSITEVTSAYLFGGATSFKARRDLYSKVQQLLSSTGVLTAKGPSLPSLEPPYTGGLAELAIRFIDRPQAAILIPQILQDHLWRMLGASGAPGRDDVNSLAAEKLAQDLLDFLKTAAGAIWVPKL
jgi:hypothetical protein